MGAAICCVLGWQSMAIGTLMVVDLCRGLHYWSCLLRRATLCCQPVFAILVDMVFRRRRSAVSAFAEQISEAKAVLPYWAVC